ncbi:flavin monoamine oxidase family protein [Salisediminibacterium selenitireducens]|uniref:Amine oxidase n=1 Tax=Bacillus selenitireducens (strain ATCC 700615 / DSM 15326 / MLS10) TaxID=439292 RepID=D6XWH5_BACIE|nr:FAD-dependent oxidoreductase [Salisediminibacterium selenitireducens]ADH97817.1 amine oxidase [[Bacillus] selenitireducens MLS10]
MPETTIIIGAGLSGLYAASLLHKRGLPVCVLETRPRTGGRILSKTVPDRPELGRFDLGPTWYWPEHEPLITDVIDTLGLEAFEQYTAGDILLERSENAPLERHTLPPGAQPRAMRLAGGIGRLTDALYDSLPDGTVALETAVTDLTLNVDGSIRVGGTGRDNRPFYLDGTRVITALPPRLLAERITFDPALPNGLHAALRSTPTWMAGHAKAVAVYDTPFWREDGLSGQAMSWAGPLQEIHDASPNNGSGALFGFFGIDAKARQSPGEPGLKEAVTDQLMRLFGKSAGKPIEVLIYDWARDSFTATSLDERLAEPASFPGPVSLWDGRLLFAGTETDPSSGGHLEGALQAGKRAADAVTD